MDTKFSMQTLKTQSSRTSVISVVQERNRDNTDDAFYTSFPTWSSRLNCLLAYVCVIMDFKAVIRFCYSLGVYGCAFFVPHFIFELCIGLPLILMEITMGRYVTGYMTRIYLFCPFAKGILVCLFLSTSFEISLDFVHLTYLFRYLISFYQGHIVWAHCEKPWAKVNCYERKDNVTVFLKCLKQNSLEFCQKLSWEMSGRQFWENVVFNHSSVDSVAISAGFLILGIGIVIIINYKGIRSLEKSFIIFVIPPIVLATFLTLATFFISGSDVGFFKVWFLDVSLLRSPEMWVRGLEDALSPLKVGIFALPFVSSHGNFDDDILYDVFTVIFSDFFCCLILAVPILTAIEIIKFDRPLFNDYVDTYVWMSEALIIYPRPNTFWAMLFYLEMTIIQLGSQSILCLSFFEVVFSLCRDAFASANAMFICIGLAVLSFFLAILLIIFPIPHFCPLGTIVLVVVFLSIINFQLFYGLKKFNDDFHFMMGYHPPFIFSCAEILSLGITFIFIILKLVMHIPKEPVKYAIYIYVGIPFLLYFATAIVKIYEAYKKKDILKAFLANPEWGPSLPILIKSRIVFDSKAVTKEFMYRQELYKKPLMKPNDFSEQNIVHLI